MVSVSGRKMSAATWVVCEIIFYISHQISMPARYIIEFKIVLAFYMLFQKIMVRGAPVVIPLYVPLKTLALSASLRLVVPLPPEALRAISFSNSSS